MAPSTDSAKRIRVGVAGWDYPDWKGVVYPARAARGFDRLDWISRFVDVVEVNATFYRPVAPRVAESWVRRTERRRDFLFTAKSHRSWTHDPEEALEDSVEETLAGLRPLRDAGRLGALLVQFPQSFHYDQASRERIARIAETAAGWPLAVEVRHVSWEADEAAEGFRALGLGWCLVDQPRVGRSTARPLARRTAPIAYMRMHGRNAGNWFRADAGRDARYDYLYSTTELDDLARRGRELAQGAEQLFAIQNNHFRGQALVNALQLRHLLEGEPPRAPQELVDVYPALAADVVVERRRLF